MQELLEFRSLMGRIAAASTSQATVRSRDSGRAHDLDLSPPGRLGGVGRGPRRIESSGARGRAASDPRCS